MQPPLACGKNVIWIQWKRANHGVVMATKNSVSALSRRRFTLASFDWCSRRNGNTHTHCIITLFGRRGSIGEIRRQFQFAVWHIKISTSRLLSYVVWDPLKIVPFVLITWFHYILHFQIPSIFVCPRHFMLLATNDEKKKNYWPNLSYYIVMMINFKHYIWLQYIRQRSLSPPSLPLAAQCCRAIKGIFQYLSIFREPICGMEIL